MRRVLIALLLATSVQAEEVHVAAASSLQDVLAALTPLYEAKTKDKIVSNFAGSNALARQIRAGAPADVFFSADTATMDTVRTLARADILRNRLKILGNLRTARRVALANPAAVPAGIYARQYLQRAGLWAMLAPKVIPTENVRAALAAYEGGNVDAAIVYATDAPKLPGVVVAGKLAPDIRYPAAVVEGARHPAAARRFLAFLTSTEAMAVFKRFGFLECGGKAAAFKAAPPAPHSEAPRPASSRSAGTTSTRPVRSKS
jgi:molybdate transport system substrate-binding protein